MALTDNIVAYYKFDESSGNAEDSVGSLDLTNRNSVAFTTGKINNGADFEYGSNQGFSITDAASSGAFDLIDNFTLAFWVNFESLPSTGDAKWYIVFKNDCYQFQVPYNASGSYGLKIYLRDSTGFYSPSVAWTPSTSTWYHIAVTREKSTGYVKFYVNGSQQGTTQETGRTASLYNSSDAFEIGQAGSSGLFDGILDELGVWSRVLSDSEISQLYNSGSGLSYPFSSTSGPAHLKKFNGIAIANIKKINGIAIANVKKINSID